MHYYFPKNTPNLSFISTPTRIIYNNAEPYITIGFQNNVEEEDVRNFLTKYMPDLSINEYKLEKHQSPDKDEEIYLLHIKENLIYRAFDSTLRYAYNQLSNNGFITARVRSNMEGDIRQYEESLPLRNIIKNQQTKSQQDIIISMVDPYIDKETLFIVEDPAFSLALMDTSLDTIELYNYTKFKEYFENKYPNFSSILDISLSHQQAQKVFLESLQAISKIANGSAIVADTLKKSGGFVPSLKIQRNIIIQFFHQKFLENYNICHNGLKFISYLAITKNYIPHLKNINWHDPILAMKTFFDSIKSSNIAQKKFIKNLKESLEEMKSIDEEFTAEKLELSQYLSEDQIKLLTSNILSYAISSDTIDTERQAFVPNPENLEVYIIGTRENSDSGSELIDPVTNIDEFRNPLLELYNEFFISLSYNIDNTRFRLEFEYPEEEISYLQYQINTIQSLRSRLAQLYNSDLYSPNISHMNNQPSLIPDNESPREEVYNIASSHNNKTIEFFLGIGIVLTIAGTIFLSTTPLTTSFLSIGLGLMFPGIICATAAIGKLIHTINEETNPQNINLAREGVDISTENIHRRLERGERTHRTHPRIEL